MFSRHTLLLTMLLGAAVIPYASSNPELKAKIAAFWPSGAKSEAAAANDGKPQAYTPTGQQQPGAGAAAIAPPRNSALLTPPVYALTDVLTFEISPGWVLSHWPRVSAGLAELDLQGYRVSLITGTSDGDLAGSLTYYFDKKQRVDRISFHGTTGDVRPLVNLVTSRFELKRQQTDDPSLWLYQVKWNGVVRSELRIRPVPVVRASVPRSRFEVEMLLERPR